MSWDGPVKRLRGPEINQELEPDRLFDGRVWPAESMPVRARAVIMKGRSARA